MSLTIRDLAKSFPAPRREQRGRIAAVAGVSLDVAQGELFTLLGPSGCGKTTLLRCVAGLEEPEAGEIVVAGRTLHSSKRGIRVPPSRRGLGMVFQSYAIWPHMNVFQNVAFPLIVAPRSRRLPRREIRARVERILSLVKLSDLGWRAATDLSGGQQQRLALARSLVMEPPLLLLDEPLSSIDAKLRAEMRFELKRLQQTIGTTTVYVTHDQEEALALSSVMAVMRDGLIEQVGTPRDVYAKPSSRFVADFIGAANLIEGIVEARANGVCTVRTAVGLLRAAAGDSFSAGASVVVVVRAEHVGLEAGNNPAGPNRWRGVVQTPAFRGDSVDHEIAVGALKIRVRTEPSLALAPGGEVTVTFREDACILIGAD